NCIYKNETFNRSFIESNCDTGLLIVYQSEVINEYMANRSKTITRYQSDEELAKRSKLVQFRVPRKGCNQKTKAEGRMSELKQKHKQRIENPKTDPRRVKVYELQAQTWIDRGTGHCIGIYEQNSTSHQPIARIEVRQEPTDSSPGEGGGIYQKQQATLVVWTEPDGTDMALSFATAQGCQEMWSFLCDVQNWLVKLPYTPLTPSNSHQQDNLSSTSNAPQATSRSNGPHQDHLNSHRRKDAIDWDDDELNLSNTTQPISNHHTRQLQLTNNKSNNNLQHQSIGNGELEGHPVFAISRDGLDPEDLTKTRLISTSGNGSPPTTYNHLLKPNLQHIPSHQFNHLPEPSLANLIEIENLIKSSACSSIGRERISTLILKKDYIRKLDSVRIEAEDLESLKDLHTLCILLQSILMLNDAAIYEYCLQDDIVFKEVIPIRDEQIKSKIHLTYRLQYFKDIILARIMDDSTFSIINSMLFFNQVEIVQYLHSSDHFMRDLFGIFDIQVNEVTTGSSSPIVGPSLPPSMISERAKNLKLDGQALLDKKIDSIMFLQQLCSMAKQLQAPSRISFFRSLAERGVLKVIEFGLSNLNLSNEPPTINLTSEISTVNFEEKSSLVLEEEAMIKSVVCEILMTIIDYDPSSVRGYCLKQREEKTKTLTESLIELLISENDLGLKVQLTDALRTLLDIGGGIIIMARCRMDEDPDNERFLQFFYDHCVHVLASPFLNLPDLTPHSSSSSSSSSHAEDQEQVSVSPSEAATFNHLCEMICFIIIQHSFRSKYFILSTNLLNKVGSLLRIIGPGNPFASDNKESKNVAEDGNTKKDQIDEPNKHKSKLNTQRRRRKLTCFNKKDQFYDRALIKNSLIDQVVLDLFVYQDGKDNLVSSACLELFENIRLNNPKPIINHLMDKRLDLIKKLSAKFITFQSLLQRWEQNNDHPNGSSNPTSNLQSSSNNHADDNPSHNVRNIGSWSRSRTLDAEEENYFNDSDDSEEEGDVMISSTSRMAGVEGLGIVRGRTLVDGPSHKRQRSMTSVSQGIIPDFGVEAKACPTNVGTSLEGSLKPLVDYPDEDDDGPPAAAAREDEEDLNGLGGLLGASGGREAKRGKRSSVPMARTSQAASKPAPSSLPASDPSQAVPTDSPLTIAFQKKSNNINPVAVASHPTPIQSGNKIVDLGLGRSSSFQPHRRRLDFDTLSISLLLSPSSSSIAVVNTTKDDRTDKSGMDPAQPVSSDSSIPSDSSITSDFSIKDTLIDSTDTHKITPNSSDSVPADPASSESQEPPVSTLPLPPPALTSSTPLSSSSSSLPKQHCQLVGVERCYGLNGWEKVERREDDERKQPTKEEEGVNFNEFSANFQGFGCAVRYDAIVGSSPSVIGGRKPRTIFSFCGHNEYPANTYNCDDCLNPSIKSRRLIFGQLGKGGFLKVSQHSGFARHIRLDGLNILRHLIGYCPPDMRSSLLKRPVRASTYKHWCQPTEQWSYQGKEQSALMTSVPTNNFEG
ncbi:hypothetical protein PSHT_15279, partial [Puccinia striiformis]